MGSEIRPAWVSQLINYSGLLLPHFKKWQHLKKKTTTYHRRAVASFKWGAARPVLSDARSAWVPHRVGLLAVMLFFFLLDFGLSFATNIL